MSGGWAFVDVETTGLNPSWDRVVSVSVLAFDDAGRLDGQVHSLVNPGRDPGPVHIHGLTAQMLATAPRYPSVAAKVRDLMADRVLVAHNAQFDYRFLHAEGERASVPLPTTRRLCTVAFSRRLDLPVTNHKLATVAAYWGVPQYAAHDSRDDVRVLREVFLHSQALAARIGVVAPVMSCEGRGAVVYPARIPRVPSPYENPATWTPPARLVQGMKIVITGPTLRAREELVQELVGHGFDVMNNVSGQTRLLVCNEPLHASVKHEKARNAGIPVMTEAALVALLDRVEPGVLRGQRAAGTSGADGARPSRSDAAPRRAATGGPWSGRSVLVLGGDATSAADARERVGALGARVLVNLGARTTHVLVLDGGERDRRYPKVVERAIPMLGLSDLNPEAGPTADPAPTPTSEVDGVVLGRGHVIDLPQRARRLALSASWSAATAVNAMPYEVDVVAFALRADELVAADEDFVFYNQPSTPDGSLRLTVDGDCEQGIETDLDAIDDDTARVRIAASIDGSVTFASVGAIRLSLTDSETGGEIASATLDAATEERSLVLADVYRRGGGWRFRAVGQGYEAPLKDLVVRHGVHVE